MKDFFISLLVLALLILLFSTATFPEDTAPMLAGIGKQYPGDYGMVLPGGGADIAEVVTETAAHRAQTHKPSEGTDEAKKGTKTKNEMEAQNKMDGMLDYWAGVATVLIGETVALMVAAAWMKIATAWMKTRGGKDGTNGGGQVLR